MNSDILRNFFAILRQAFAEFRLNDPLKFGAATAFFSTFALPPIMVILISMLGLLFDAENISTELIQKLTLLFGKAGASLIQSVLENIQTLRQNFPYTVLGSLFLLFVSTTLFIVVQNSLNQLWSVRPQPSKKFHRKLKSRLTALILIFLTGLLFLITLFTDSLLAYLGANLSLLLPSQEARLLRLVNVILAIAIVTVWFALLLKFLPDIQIPWKPVWVGAVFTSLLFNAGKYLLHLLLINGKLGTIYEASASIVLVLLFIFYAAMMFFFGAAFTKAYAVHSGVQVLPKPYAVGYTITIQEREDKPLAKKTAH